MSNLSQNAASIHAAALGWYLDAGIDEALLDAPQDRRNQAPPPVAFAPPAADKPGSVAKVAAAAPAQAIIPKSDVYDQAVELAKAAMTLEELREAIAGFDGIALKKTATNLVFADGNPNADVMLIGEAPGADEDRAGLPFMGASGQLQDKILACIDLDRTQDDPKKSVYISNILNWRPPGNRSPAPAEIELSLPFIERHIQLAQPKLLILCGGVSAKALLNTEESISKLRKRWHEYTPVTQSLRSGAQTIPAIATYHPSYLLKTPSQKRAVWADMLAVQERKRGL